MARLCLANLAEGDTTFREMKAVIEDLLSPEYQGRVLVELLQNAHDAHPATRSDGRVEILLDEDEGEHGVLYVANGGRALKPKDFQALCRVALSSKRPDEGIGHKGVGFKSVRQLTEAPELYSVSGPEAKAFDGFCFRFARSADFDWLAEQVAPDDTNAAEQLRENLSTLKVPAALDEVPESVQRFRRRGIVTVVRLPLQDAEARQAAVDQFSELTDDSAPFELFLDRLAVVSVVHTAVGSTKRTVYRRQVTSLYSSRDLKIQEVALRRGLRLIVVRSKVAAERAQEVIAVSGTMGAAWKAWQGAAEVAVAVPVDEPLTRGRLYTFLPMSTETPCPVNGYVNAPFFSHVSRRTFAADVPWNSLLLDEVAAACARAAVLADEGRVELPGNALVDLLCRQANELPRLDEAFRKLDGDLDEVSFIPAVHPVGGRTSFSAGFLWDQPDSVAVFTPHAIGQTGVAEIIDPGLHAVRANRLRAMGRLRGLSLEPGRERLSQWAEAVAEVMASRTNSGEVDHDRWADFYHDLSLYFPDGGPLRGKKVIFSSTGDLVPAGDDSVFFPDAGDPLLQGVELQAGLGEYLSFVHDEIPWLAGRGKRGQRRAHGRRWLEQQRLVQEYGPATLLTVLAKVMQQDGQSEEALRHCLLLACRLWSGLAARNNGRAPAIDGLIVPTRGGWSPTWKAMFGPGWEGRTAGIDDTLARFLTRTRSLAGDLTAADNALVRPAVELCAGSEVEPTLLKRFLEQQGVRHGLRPRYLGGKETVKGDQLNYPSQFVGYWSHTPTTEARQQWRMTAARWPNRHDVRFATVAYRPTNILATLPGQGAYAAFDEDSRRLYAELIVHGLGTWPDSALEVRFIGGSDRSGTLWPTPLAAFLSQAPWIPQTAEYQGQSGFASASTAWWWAESDPPPAYLAVVSAVLRQLTSDRVLDRLRLLRVRRWADPQTARDRLRHLPELLSRSPQLRYGPLAVALYRAYEQAWSDLLPPYQQRDTRQASDRVGALSQLLVSRASVLEVLPAAKATKDADTEPVYVPDPRSGQQRKLLDQIPVPVLALDDRALGSRVHDYLSTQDGFSVRRISGATVQVVADRVPAPMAPSTPLLEFTGQWLRTLVAAVVEFDEERSTRPGPVSIAHLNRRLRSCALVLASEALTRVAGQVIDDPGTERSLLHDDPERPCLVVVHAPPHSDWRVLQTAATAIAELVGAPYLATPLQLALMKLERHPAVQRLDEVGDAEIAAVLGLSVQQIEAVLADRASTRSGSARLVPVLACEDLALAEELQQHQESFNDRGELQAWLTDRLGSERAELLLSLPEEDWQRRLTLLGVPLERANRSWQALGLPTIDNTTAHARQFEAWLQHNRPLLVDQVRDAFVGAYRARQDLGTYVRLRALPELGPDPEWHWTLWDLPAELLAEEADRWLTNRLPTSAEQDGKRADKLRPVAEVREVCVDFVHARLPGLRGLIERWLAQHETAGTTTCPGATEVAREMDAEGILDFEPLNSRALIAWLQSRGYWPVGMPASARAADLGLDRQPLAPPGPNTGQTGVQAGRPPMPVRGPLLELNGESLPVGSDDLRELARRVALDLTQEQLATSAALAVPRAPAAAPVSVIPRQRGTSGAAARGEGGNREAADPHKLIAIGLAGEVTVGAWLQEKFGVPPQESWKSRMRRHVFADGNGDDSLGYDFLIRDGDRILLFEVKASTQSSGEILLGESEVERASHLGPNEEYIIVYVSHVMDRDRRRLTPLPNPFSAPGLAGYQVVSTSMRLRFSVPTAE